MPLDNDEIRKILDISEEFASDGYTRLSHIARLTNLGISSIYKSADILGFNYELNPNTKILNAHIFLILKNITDHSGNYECQEAGVLKGFGSLLRMIENPLYKGVNYEQDINYLQSKIFKSNNSIFKYLPFNINTIASLENSYIYHSKVADFNDPFDCNARLLGKIMRKDTYPEEAAIPVADFITHVGISCFSKTNSSILMWSHYAEKHSGICIEYSSYELNLKSNDYSQGLNKSFHQKLLKNVFSVFNKLYEVEYFSTLKKHTVIQSRKGLFNTINHLFLTKYTDWSYEQEVRRVIYLESADNVGDRMFYHEPRLIKAIYFGALANDSTIEHVCRIAKDKYKNKIKLFRSVLSSSVFGIEFVPIDNFE